MIRKKGILFWIEGYSGSGKTTIAKKIRLSIIKKYGPTILIKSQTTTFLLLWEYVDEIELKTIIPREVPITI